MTNTMTSDANDLAISSFSYYTVEREYVIIWFPKLLSFTIPPAFTATL
jgi:hypothetical protein